MPCVTSAIWTLALAPAVPIVSQISLFADFAFHTFCASQVLEISCFTHFAFRTFHVFHISHSAHFAHFAHCTFVIRTFHTSHFLHFSRFFSHLYYCMVIAPFHPFSASHTFIPIFTLAPSVTLPQPAITALLAPLCIIHHRTTAICAPALLLPCTLPRISLTCLPPHRICHSHHPLALAFP